MIDHVTIKNFQSHKNTNIEFQKNGVNVIVGTSDQGKSAILRAILWAVNNRPLGTDDIVSHWARDNKNKIADTMVVKIATDLGICTRQRSADANEYILRGDNKEKKFEAVNKDVPEDVQKFFRLTDVNIQNQHDAPFLLSASASDVAKYFNKIVRLDVIDVVLGNAESARRDTNKKIKECDLETKNLEKQLKDFEWIETAQELSEKLLKVNERITIYKTNYENIDSEIIDYTGQKDFLKNFPDVKKAKTLIEGIENIKIDYDGLNELEKSIDKYKKVNRDRKIFEMIKPGKDILIKIEGAGVNIQNYIAEINILQKEINEYTENKKLSEMGFDKKVATDLIKEIENIKPDYDSLRLLHAQIQEFENAKKEVEKAVVEKTNLIRQLPAVCPECGQPIMECVE